MNDPRYPQFQGYPQMPPQGPAAMPGYPPTGYPPAAPGYPAAAPPGPAPGAIPAYYIPDEQQVLAGYAAAREAVSKAGGGGRAQFVKFMGPRGETKWGNSVQIGFVSNLPVYILPAPQPKPGHPPSGIYIETNNHFWKSAAHPQGMQISCAGPGKCLICAARELGLAHPDPQIQKRAKEFGRVRTQYFYQVVLLQFPQAHLGQDGQMHPQILGAGKKMHTAIGDLIQNRGLPRIVDPVNGRPIMLKKVKTGPEERDVEYGALDLEPQPLPPMFYPCLRNLYDLADFVKVSTHEDMMKAVMEMGIPMPGQAQAPSAAFNPAPQAPWGDPNAYQQQAPYQQPQGQFQGFQPQPAAYQPMGPPPVPGQAQVYQPPGDPYQFPPVDASGGFQGGIPPQPPPPMGPMGGYPLPTAWSPAPAYSAQTATAAVPPPMNPPPVSSPPGYQTIYQPQPGTPGQAQAIQTQFSPPSGPAPAPGAHPPPPGVPTGAPVMAVASETPHQITMPVPSGSLPVGRDRCFSKPNPTDHWCVNCPDWIKGQCFQVAAMNVSAAPGQQQPGGDQLANLQAQLSGKVR